MFPIKQNQKDLDVVQRYLNSERMGGRVVTTAMKQRKEAWLILMQGCTSRTSRVWMIINPSAPRQRVMWLRILIYVLQNCYFRMMMLMVCCKVRVMQKKSLVGESSSWNNSNTYRSRFRRQKALARMQRVLVWGSLVKMQTQRRVALRGLRMSRMVENRKISNKDGRMDRMRMYRLRTADSLNQRLVDRLWSFLRWALSILQNEFKQQLVYYIYSII